MEKIRLGRTGLMVGRSGFGAIPIQRIGFDAAKEILLRAYDCGINFFDTARAYADSEEKIGYALSPVRSEIIIATKTMAQTAAGLFDDLETSLRSLKTDYIDIYQFHNATFMPEEDGELYQAAVKAKREGKIRFISISSHRADLAVSMIRSGLFDTMQFPLSSLSSDDDLKVVEECKLHDIGLIAMKAMSGGLLRSPKATFAFIRKLENAVPIWGIEHLWQLEEFIELEKNPPELNDELMEIIRRDREELAGNFCRGCGYCMPTCPAEIPIMNAARMSLILGRMDPKLFTTPEIREGMDRIQNCTECGECMKHCPYNLDTPSLLKYEYKFYQKYLRENNLA